MKNKTSKNILIGITSIFIITLILVGLTYAYYRTRIIGNESIDPSISVQSKKLEITYVDGTTSFIPVATGQKEAVNGTKSFEPGDKYIKEFSVKNTGDDTVNNYAVIMEEVFVTYTENSGDLLAGDTAVLKYPKDYKLTITCTSSIEGKNCDGFSGDLPIFGGLLVNNSIDSEEIQNYIMTLEYLETKINQSDDMGKKIEGKINIVDSTYSVYSMNVGDYVNYQYTGATYTTPTIDSGKSINTTTQTFSSQINGNTEIKSWRVLSIENGIVKLIGDVPSAQNDSIIEGKLELFGENAYLNAEYVMNEMCNTLYSSEYGIARSININDINKISGYYRGGSYSDVLTDPVIGYERLAGDDKATLGELETRLGKKIGGSRIAPKGYEKLEDIEVNYIVYSLKSDDIDALNNALVETDVEWDLLMTDKETGANKHYWIATSVNHISFKDNIVKYGVLSMQGQGYINRRHIYNSEGEEQTDLIGAPQAVVPIVELNKNIAVNKISTNLDGTTVWSIG